MKSSITRRDFLNGTQLALGAALTAPVISACGAGETPNPFSLANGYYPPAKTGLRGSHDGAWETMHARVAGKEWPVQEPGETYDLIIVGGGISGLAAANFYARNRPDAKILILDNHDDFGGHAKRNEFQINGEARITFGGTEAIDTPSHYTAESIGLMRDIGIETERFYDYYKDGLYDAYGLSKSIMFDRAAFGEDKLVAGYGSRDWAAFAADAPLSEKARQDFIRVQTENIDYLPGMTFDEKYELLRRTSYETFLRDHCKVDEEVINIYKRWGMSFWCVGIDEVPATSIQDYDGGMPGVAETLRRTGYRNDEPYVFHFPDGNASVARLLVRALNPEAAPGETMEDVVTSRFDYSKLDRRSQAINIRLSSTAVHVENTPDGRGVEIIYVHGGKAHTARAANCVLACYNGAIPYLCPDMPDSQREALSYGVKAPLVYTKVLVPNWKAFAEIGTDFVYYTGGFFKQVEFAYPVSLGDYQCSQTPDDPMILHMCHVPWVPDIQGKDQWREGRRRMLSAPFEEFERQVRTQLDQALSGAGYDADRDIRGITVNRWSHGYAYDPTLIWEPDWPDEASKPWVIGRQPFGRIHIANSDAGAAANTDCAISQGHRAVQEILG